MVKNLTRTLVFLCLWAGASAAAEAVAVSSPYEALRAAFAARSAAQAQSAISEQAVVLIGRRPERRRGRDAIGAYLAAQFGTAGEGALGLNFRRTRSIATVTGSQDSGYFRVRRPGRAEPLYGRFSATLRRDADGAVRIARAGIRAATEADFEDATGPVLFAPDTEELSAYYDRFLGRYRRADGCDVVVTRTLRRLWARDSCALEWRSLTRVAGREWTGGNRVISAAVVSRYRFEGNDGASPRRLRIEGVAPGSLSFARRVDPYRIEQIVFSSADGTRLAGQVWIPTGNSRRIGIALAHGSGAQDRNGYASFLAVLADQLAAQGYTVVTYDKRGAGRSEGDWSRASFAVLADDLAAAAAALRARRDLVDPQRVGIGGSSQAGWISAKAVERGAAPAFVFLVGAGGSAMPVTVQNRYNVGVSMRCAGFAEGQIATVLDQNEAFYAFRRDPRVAAALDAKTARAARDPAIADWLLPDSRTVDASGGAWYSVMEIDFDPVPVWRRFPGPLIFVQGDQDDQTPASVVRDRLAGLDPSRLSLHILPGAQHLGLRARDVCQGARFEDMTGFHPGLFEAIAALDARLR